MPLNLTGLITTSRAARDLIVQRLEDNQNELQLGYVGKDDERRLPYYPAVVVSAGGKSREYHGTYTFNVRLECTIWVYHAKMDVGHATRSDEDLDLTDRIDEIISANMDYGGAVISSYIEDMQPGMVQPAASKSDIVIGSRLLWVALSQERFK